MRSSSLTSEQALAAEKASEDRKQYRAGGLRLMGERDLGYTVLSNGVVVHYHVSAPLEEGHTRVRVHPEQVVLDIGGKRTIFDSEELKRALRWT